MHWSISVINFCCWQAIRSPVVLTTDRLDMIHCFVYGTSASHKNLYVCHNRPLPTNTATSSLHRSTELPWYYKRHDEWVNEQILNELIFSQFLVCCHAELYLLIAFICILFYISIIIIIIIISVNIFIISLLVCMFNVLCTVYLLCIYCLKCCNCSTLPCWQSCQLRHLKKSLKT